jgi:RNA polymerase sigma factor (sigma-70 family)
MHKCYHWKRSQTEGESDLDGEHVETITCTQAIPADMLEELEREQMVREALGHLPPRCREMIELLFFEQPPVPYNEVARRLNLATGSIGFIRGRCLKRLKKFLLEKGF